MAEESKYPVSLVSDIDMPERIDGAVIYGQHMNAVQNEIIAIEDTLGLGVADAGVPSITEGGFNNLAARLRDMSDRLSSNDSHRSASTGVHGAEGYVVGTHNVQTLSNKTLHAARLTGAVDVSGATFSGGLSVNSNSHINGHLSVISFSTQTFAQAQHNHTSPATGGRLPLEAVYDPSSGKSLTQILGEQSAEGHTHTRSDITDFQHSLVSHSGNLPASRISGLGSGAVMNVPSTSGSSASATQLVRGDDPRLSNNRAPGKHAASHFSNGADRIRPVDIGAADRTHTHTRSQISNFQHTLASHTGDLAISRITGLQYQLDTRLRVDGTANNSVLSNGKKFNVQRTAPVTAAVGDVWISY